MKAVCSRCNKQLGDWEPKEDPSPTFGMCVDCLEFLEKEWRGMTVADYLETVDAPVLLLDGEGRMVSCNKKAEKHLGKSARVMRGLMVGEFLECQNSVLSGGCGKSVHCSACTIRKSLDLTTRTGLPVVKAPAFLHAMQHGMPITRQITVSTEKAGGMVRLIVDGVDQLPKEDPHAAKASGRDQPRRVAMPEGPLRIVTRADGGNLPPLADDVQPPPGDDEEGKK